MKKAVTFLLLVSVIISCKKKPSDIELLTEGVSYQMALYRKQQVKNVVYRLDFNIPEKKTETIPAKLQLDVTIENLKKDLYLDFNEQTSKLKRIKVNGNITPIKHEKEHVIILKDYLIEGGNIINISFDAGELSLNRNDDFLYTLLVPDRASTLFPCFDQPDIKANYKLTIKAPKEWKVLCGAFEEEQIEKEDFIVHKFAATDKMSTYLFSFVAGNFKEEVRNPGAFDMRFLYRENSPEKITESLDEIFNIHQKSFDFLEKYTAHEFPFQKMDFAGIPSFQYGGMEHVGAIQYKESSLFLDKNATQTRKLSRAKLIAHETSHMWFGNLVTMRWFDDVWMKEVFANFMADKIMNPVFPEINHDLNFMMEHYPSAYSEDRTKGTNAIKQPLDNLKNAGSLYGRIIYNKAPVMMRQLENILGKDNFKKGIQEYIESYADGNADWNELVTILDKKSSKDIKQWSKVWVNSSGRPIFSDNISYKDGKILSYVISQEAEDFSNNIWPQSFKVGFVYNDTIKLLDANILSKSLNVIDAIGFTKPNQIIYNYDGFGYGVFPIEIGHINDYKNIKNDVGRGYAYINLYENVLNGNIPILDAYHVFLESIVVERNELIMNYLSGRIKNLFWTFLTKNERIEVLEKCEKTVLDLLEANILPNKKRILFKLYQSIAFSSQGKENLYKIWDRSLKFQSLKLNETDYTSLAMRLAIFKHENSEDILNTQAINITNKDRLSRFMWLLPSLSQDISIRDAFMDSLKKVKNREKESWVVMALNNIHHPLRHESSTKHIKLCLELLEEIQLTGDIFFPKNWLLNSIGNYSSKEALVILKDFLTSLRSFI